MNKTAARELPDLLTPLLVTIPQAAAMIARGVSSVYVAIGDGKIKAVKSDRRTLVAVDSLREYVAKLPPAKIRPTSRERQKTALAKPPLIRINRHQRPASSGRFSFQPAISKSRRLAPIGRIQMTCWRLNPEPPMANAIEAIARSEGRTVSNCLR
jgi:hypothetical protein